MDNATRRVSNISHLSRVQEVSSRRNESHVPGRRSRERTLRGEAQSATPFHSNHNATLLRLNKIRASRISQKCSFHLLGLFRNSNRKVFYKDIHRIKYETMFSTLNLSSSSIDFLKFLYTHFKSTSTETLIDL